MLFPMLQSLVVCAYEIMERMCRHKTQHFACTSASAAMTLDISLGGEAVAASCRYSCKFWTHMFLQLINSGMGARAVSR